MIDKKVQSYLSYLFSGFSVVMTVTGVFQYNTRWMSIALAASALLAVVGVYFFFRLRRNVAFKDLEDIPPEYWTAKASADDIKVVAELDQNIYGNDSVDYPGLLDWWGRYKGVTVLREDSRIIGAVGIWPLTKEAHDKLVAGHLDESRIDGRSICEESDPAPRPYWYFGDIVLLRQYRRKMENLSLVLLADGVRDWVENGNLADELHLCALAFKEPGDLRPSSEWDGAKFLSKFKFTTKVNSPSGYPVYTRAVAKAKLLEEVEKRIAARLELTRARCRRGAAAPPPPPSPAARRWQWVPATAAAALLIAAVVVKQLPSSTSRASVVEPAYLDAPQEIVRQTAEVLRVGVRDHTHCAVDLWDEQTVGEKQMAKELGKRHADLLGVVREGLAGAYEIAAAHRCEAEGRKYVHLILRGSEVLLSVVVTEKGGKTFPQHRMATARIVSGVPLYRAKLKTFEAAGFETQEHLVFVISNLGEEENLGVASRLAPGVRRFLGRLES